MRKIINLTKHPVSRDLRVMGLPVIESTLPAKQLVKRQLTFDSVGRRGFSEKVARRFIQLGWLEKREELENKRRQFEYQMTDQGRYWVQSVNSNPPTTTEGSM